MMPRIRTFFDEATSTFTHVVSDTMRCAIIDPVLDYDPKSGRTSHDSVDQVIEYVRSEELTLDWVLETHTHADHLSAAPYLRDTLGGKVAVGAEITQVQSIFKDIFNVEPTFATDGSQFDHLFKDGEKFTIGELQAYVLHTPGHTPACLTYVIDDAAFVGDTLFMPDYGTARADFPGGDAATLYRSIQMILALPDETRLFMCHDYLPATRSEFQWETTVGEQKANNIHIQAGVSEGDFVAMREARDKTLAAPVLLLPSVQVNIRAGELPPPEDNGVSYLKIPLNLI